MKLWNVLVFLLQVHYSISCTAYVMESLGIHSFIMKWHDLSFQANSKQYCAIVAGSAEDMPGKLTEMLFDL